MNQKVLINDECLFCKIIKSEVPCYKVYENEYVLAFLDIFPAVRGHTLIIPKSHSEYYSNTDDVYLSEVAKAAKIIAEQMYEKLDAKGINYIVNEQEIAYQQVFHYHMHILPKYKKEHGYSHKVIKNEKEEIKDFEKILQEIKIKN